MQRTPSAKALAAVFTDAAEAKRIISMDYAELRKLPAAQSRIGECFNPPSKYDVRMHCLNAIEPGLHGLEAMACVTGEYADYLNTGDTYAPTLIYWRGNYRVQSVGDFIETMERSGVKFA
jgi:hypothetical protein